MTDLERFVSDPRWLSECNKWRHRVLTGNRSHYCFYWDGLPVDETCENEWPCPCAQFDEDWWNGGGEEAAK